MQTSSRVAGMKELSHLERLTAHDAVVSTRCMMNAPPHGSAEELEQAMATLTGLYDAMLVDAIPTGNDEFLNELAVWMQPFRQKEAIQQARHYIETLPKQPE